MGSHHVRVNLLSELLCENQPLYIESRTIFSHSVVKLVMSVTGWLTCSNRSRLPSEERLKKDLVKMAHSPTSPGAPNCTHDVFFGSQV